MMKRVKQEIDYRLSKWLIWNAGIEQLLTSAETESMFRELLSFYDPPTRCIERVQSMHDRKSDTASFKHKTICGLCGKNYGTRTWHCNDRVWSCRERGITGHTCQNSQVYDYAFQQMIKRSLLLLLPDRTGIKKECERLVRRYVYDKSRLRNAVEYIRTFAESDTTTIELGDEAGFIVEWLTIYPKDHVVAKIIDDEKISFQQAHYTPHIGWIEYPKKPAPAPLELSEDEMFVITAVKRKEGQHTMTTEQKKAIETLRLKGASTGDIARLLNISVNTIKTHLWRHPVVSVVQKPELPASLTILKCKNCGKDVIQIPGRKAKLFCNDVCRHKWWGTHANQAQRKSSFTFVCVTCGKEFIASVNSKRKYCCHECYVENRFYQHSPTTAGKQ